MSSTKQNLWSCAASIGMLLVLSNAARSSPQPSSESRLYAPCVVCHQPSAWGSPDGAIPALAGQQARYLKRQMLLFESGARLDTAMQIVAAHTTKRSAHDIALLAAYLTNLDSNPSPVHGTGDHLRLGQEEFTHTCSACHGADGLGNTETRAPRVGGQHYVYLRRQIEAAADLHKDFSPPEMTSALRGMLPQDKDALADYISRLGHSEVVLDSAR